MYISISGPTEGPLLQKPMQKLDGTFCFNYVENISHNKRQVKVVSRLHFGLRCWWTQFCTDFPETVVALFTLSQTQKHLAGPGSSATDQMCNSTWSYEYWMVGDVAFTETLGPLENTRVDLRGCSVQKWRRRIQSILFFFRLRTKPKHRLVQLFKIKREVYPFCDQHCIRLASDSTWKSLVQCCVKHVKQIDFSLFIYWARGF